MVSLVVITWLANDNLVLVPQRAAIDHGTNVGPCRFVHRPAAVRTWKADVVRLLNEAIARCDGQDIRN